MLSRPSTLLRSGTKIDPDFASETGISDDVLEPVKKVVLPIDLEGNGLVNDIQSNATDEDWEDVDSDLDLIVGNADQSSTTTHLDTGCVSPVTGGQQDDEGQATASDRPLGKREWEDSVGVGCQIETILEQETGLAKHETVKASDFCQLPALLSVPPPLTRSSSAPPEDTQPRVDRLRPRVSDDTAILHAFLDRAAASKKPQAARRESLTNKRDSGLVRNALASPLKSEVLAELDVNSPSPHKTTRSISPQVHIPPEESKQQVGGQAKERPARRSNRSRVRPALLVNQAVEDTGARIPNKITVRQTSDPLTLKRADVQELSVQTRSNTRKNKGVSIMPTARLAELKESQPGPVEAGKSREQSKGETRKSVRWDSTLAYYSDAQVQALQSEATLVAPALVSAQGADSAVPPSPTKTRSRRTRATKPNGGQHCPSAIVDGPSTVEELAKAAQPTTKRRSRIATPAKGLLSKASLLPDELEPSTVAAAVPRKPTTPTTGLPADFTTQQSAVAVTRRRGLPTPSASTRQGTTASVVNTSSKPTGPQSSSTPSTSTAPVRPSSSPRKHAPALPTTASSVSSGIPSVPVFAPRITEVPRISHLDFEAALAQSDPPTATSSSKRVRSGVPPMSRMKSHGPVEDVAASAGVPSLASPAKRRRRVGGIPDGGGEDIGPAAVGGRAGTDDRAAAPGLSSPAKKRGRPMAL